MEPKEYADYLYDLYYDLIDHNDIYWNIKETVKKCAIKAVEQVMQSNPTIKGNSEDFITQIVQTKAYYVRVIQEIEKM